MYLQLDRKSADIFHKETVIQKCIQIAFTLANKNCLCVDHIWNKNLLT